MSDGQPSQKTGHFIVDLTNKIMAKTDIFGEPVPIAAQGDAARSNLFGAGYSENQVNQMLGSATADQLGQWSSNTGIVQSTKGIRAAEIDNKNNAANMLDDTVTSGSIVDEIIKTYDTDIADYKNTAEQGEAELSELAKGLGILSSEEEQQVKAAGESAYASYLPLIQDAEEGKRRGLPKATIGAGERGGFMSTQFAGGAALKPTEGGDFFGEGGVLNQVKSDYDRNILLANSEAKRARLMAEAAERQAIKTGKRQDYELAERAKERAKQTIMDVVNLNQKKADAIYQYSTFQQNAVTFRNSLEDRQRAIENNDEDRAEASADKARELATDQFNSALDFLGIEGIKNNQDQLENMFKEAGFTDIKFNDVVAQMEAQAEAARLAGLPKPELRTVGKQLLSVTFNPETEEFETKVLATAPSPSPAPNGNSDDLTSEEKTFKKEKDDLIKGLAGGDMDWAEAYDTLVGIYPETAQPLTPEQREEYGANAVDETLADVLLNKAKYYNR